MLGAFWTIFPKPSLSSSPLAALVKAVEPFAGALCVAQACPWQPQEEVGKQALSGGRDLSAVEELTLVYLSLSVG